jgi:sugar phosphate isomerase/epimerase
MRFGIMTLQLSALAPPGAAAADIRTHVQALDHAAIVAQLHQTGFNTIELGGDLALLAPHAFAPAAIEALAELKAVEKISYTVHLPLWSTEPASLLEPVRLGSVEALAAIANAVRPLEPEVFVVHATGSLAAEFSHASLPLAAKESVLNLLQSRAVASMELLLERTGLPSRRLAVETVDFPFDLTLEIAHALDTSICLDTAHILCGFSGPIEVMEALERSRPRLAEVHLQDAPRWNPGSPVVYGADHGALGTGDLDVGTFLDALIATRFAGPVVLELTVPEALASLSLIRQLRPGCFGS